MSEITKKIEEIEVRNHNNLKYKLSKQVTAAIMVGSEAEAIIFLCIVFGYELDYAKKVVQFVRSEKGNFIDAPLIF